MKNYLKFPKMLSNNRGLVVTQYSLALTVVIATLVGTADFSRMVFTQQALDRAVLEGVRAAESSEANALQQAQTACRQVLVSSNLANATKVNASVIRMDNSDAIEVNASYPFRLFISRGPRSIFPSIILNATAVTEKK
jgi:hypothetical protein